ncbi:hypothetical protein K474DRAFT_1683162 [Panus rudis PR-1116 ss-1]|nr:hypothetical protein K474DRAFT_1683162 [Panus rudis PR-1116 ss-1]
MSSDLPPTYTLDPSEPYGESDQGNEPQILILPAGNSAGFQVGYLGADSERAAIEGELQVKSPERHTWGKVTMSLRTVEKADGHEIELNTSEVDLVSSSESTSTPRPGPSPSVFPFSIPLPPDTPQCLHTPHSGIIHTLTAKLQAIDLGGQIYTKSLDIHTRRYASHTTSLGIVPEIKYIDDPTRVEVQVPRTSFQAGEPLPLYLTIPTPRRELILDEGVRLRNVRAELIRIVHVKQETKDEGGPSASSGTSEGPSTSQTSTSGTVSKAHGNATSHSLDMRPLIGVPGGGEVVALSGASCRFHPSRALRVRLVLHTPVDEHPLLAPPVGEPGHQEAFTHCATISQDTLLHSVSFTVCIHVTFMNMTTHTERVSTLTIPVAILPPSAPLPEVEEDIDMAYHKKHDKPPARTVRHDDADSHAPHYEGEAGPSFHAPPPFEEREAPPPFFSSEPESSTSRPPTFLESETEIYVPSQEDPSIAPLPPPPELVFEGEGVLYGFHPTEQFDGYNQEHDRPETPPPTLEEATRDPDVTELATLTESDAINALELALEQHPDSGDHAGLPPPPLIDDEADPPPSIDSEFTSRPNRHHAPPPAFAEPSLPNAPIDGNAAVNSHGHAPPPYRVPDNAVVDDHENVSRPPPYVD